jgi:hypothetical protein
MEYPVKEVAMFLALSQTGFVETALSLWWGRIAIKLVEEDCPGL